MSDLKYAAQLALEALEQYPGGWANDVNKCTWEGTRQDAIAALQEAIKQAEPVAASTTQQGEPVGYVNPEALAWLGKPRVCEIKLCYQPDNGNSVPLYTSAQTIPEGYQLVPIEPTPEMLAGGIEADIKWQSSDDERNGFSVIYEAMLSAAPKGELE